jgi:spermidine/putrescine-binding protein
MYKKKMKKCKYCKKKNWKKKKKYDWVNAEGWKCSNCGNKRIDIKTDKKVLKHMVKQVHANLKDYDELLKNVNYDKRIKDIMWIYGMKYMDFSKLDFVDTEEDNITILLQTSEEDIQLDIKKLKNP